MRMGVREKLAGAFVVSLVIFIALSMTASRTFTKMDASTQEVAKYGALDGAITSTAVAARGIEELQLEAISNGWSQSLQAELDEVTGDSGISTLAGANATALALASGSPAVKAPLTDVEGKVDGVVTSANTTFAAAKAGDLSSARTSYGRSENRIDSLLADNETAASTAEKSMKVVLADARQVRADADSQVAMLTWVGAILMIIMVGGIGWSISRRTRSALGAAQAVSAGDVSYQFEAQGTDEIGELGIASQEMIAYLNDAAACAQRIAAGDLDVSFAPRSDNDVLGLALQDMVLNLRSRAEIAREIARGNVGVDATPLSDADQLGIAFDEMVTYLRQRSDDARRIAGGDLSLQVDVRSDHDIFGMAFSEMVERLEQRSIEAGQIADGDLSVNVTPWSADDRLGISLGRMVERLRTMIGEASQVAESLQRSSLQLSAMSADVGHGMEEIAGSIGELASGAESQVRVLEEQRGQATDASMAIERSRMFTQGGLAAVMQASEAMTELDDSSRSITDAIRRLSEKTEQIGDFVGAVSNIADQTNLLALNAAIEAARAGDLGRGFAVVADEVRKLAEESQTATNTIASIVGEIQRETQVTVAVIEQSVERTAQGSQVVGEARDAFQLINDSVAESAERIAAIVGSADTVAAVATQSSASTQQVSAATEETSASMQEMAASSGDLSRTAETLMRLTGMFRVSGGGGYGEEGELAGVIELRERGTA